MISTATSQKVAMWISKYHDADNAFWHVAAHHGPETKESRDAELRLLDASRCLMEALRKLREDA